MKKKLSILAGLFFSSVVATNVVACKDKVVEKNNLIELNANSMNTFLGRMEIDNLKPSKEELLKKIIIKNPNLDQLTINDFDFKNGINPTETFAIIVGKNHAQGQVALHYYKDKRLNFASKDFVFLLGTIKISSNVPDKSEILIGIKDKNKEFAALTINDFDFEQSMLPTLSSATIIGKNNAKNKVTLQYNDNKINLSSKNIKSELGKFIMENKKPTKDELLSAIKENNPQLHSLTLNDFEFKNIKEIETWKATIIGTNNARGQVELNYERETDLSKYLTDTNLSKDESGVLYLGSDLRVPTENQIKKALKSNANNPILNTGEIKISNINLEKKAVIIEGLDDKFYKGSVVVYYVASNFIRIKGINKDLNVHNFVTDKIGNVYAIVSKFNIYIENIDRFYIYKCNAGESDFKLVKTIMISAEKLSNRTCLKTDNDGNIYLFANYSPDDENYNCRIYKCNAGKVVFNEVAELNFVCYQVVIDKYNNIYVLNHMRDEIWRCFAGQNTYKKITLENDHKLSFWDVMTNYQGDIFVTLSNESTQSEPKKSVIYKYNNSGNKFEEFESFDFIVNNLQADMINNLYFKDVSNNKLYICLSGQKSFKEITGIEGSINNYSITTNGDVYASATGGHIIYKYSENQTKFEEFVKFNEKNLEGDKVYDLAIDKNGIIFVKTEAGLFNLNLNKGSNKFTEMETSFAEWTDKSKFIIGNDGILYLNLNNRIWKSDRIYLLS